MPTPLMNSNRAELQDHVSALIEEHKRSISIHYSELKLRLPSYLKNITLQQLRGQGVRVSPHITLPKGAEDWIRKFVTLNEKVNQTQELYIARVTKHYDDTKKALPRELLDKKIDDLTDEEWSQLGIDMPRFRAKYHKGTTD